MIGDLGGLTSPADVEARNIAEWDAEHEPRPSFALPVAPALRQVLVEFGWIEGDDAGG